jgi:hypothetical protein
MYRVECCLVLTIFTNIPFTKYAPWCQNTTANESTNHLSRKYAKDRQATTRRISFLKKLYEIELETLKLRVSMLDAS